MFELPEYQVLARQVNEALVGKTIRRGALSSHPHKFVWHNLSHEEFAHQSAGKRIGEARSQGKWLFIPLEPGCRLAIGEAGGKFLYLAPGAKVPEKYHLLLEFEDESYLSATTQMWGAYELFKAGEELQRQYIKDMRLTPLDAGFTFEYFSDLAAEAVAAKKTSAKGLLTQDQLIPGLGNAIAQDILFQAGINPRHPVDALDEKQRHALYDAILATVKAIIAQGGRYDETDLFGQPGGYQRLMDKRAAGQPCPRCGAIVEKIQYLGGACHFCPQCQIR